MADIQNNNQDNPPVKISPVVKWGFRYHSVVILVLGLLVVFGIFALDKMNKNEFPEITIREGVLVTIGKR